MRIGFVSLPLPSHLNPMTALGRKLKSPGHEVIFIGVPDAESAVRAATLDFVPFCEKEYPLGEFDRQRGKVATLHGLDVVRYTCRDLLPGLLESALEHMPQKIAETGVEALVLDTGHSPIQLVPMSLGIPYVHIWNALNMDLSGSTPPTFFSWPPTTKLRKGKLLREKPRG
jgi:zeaxanthin glucosyltransferase